MEPAPNNQLPSSSFADRYPNLSWLVMEGRGSIELGPREYCRSMVRILDEGGMLWEGRNSYRSMDDMLADAEKGVIRFREQEGL